MVVVFHPSWAMNILYNQQGYKVCSLLNLDGKPPRPPPSTLSPHTNQARDSWPRAKKKK